MTTFDLDRRQLLGGALGAAAITALGPRLASGATPKTLIGIIDEEPPFFNPAISSAISSYVASAPIYSGLAWTDINGKLHPDLAESWETSADGTTYTFKLRKDVLWHDGKPFTAADAKFSLSEFTAKLHPSAKGAYKSLAGMDTPDDYTLVIRMSRPVAAFLSVPTALWPIFPRHIWEGTDPLKNPANRKPVGTGPFKFAEYKGGDSLTLVKNEKYHVKGRPAFDEFVLRFMPDAATRVASFERGEADIMFSTAVPSTELGRLSKMSGVELKFATMSGGAWMGNINIRNAPYSDVRVRQALMHAIDRAFIRDTVLPGIAENMLGPVPPSSPLYNKALVDYEFSPAKANALLDAAGFPVKGGSRFDFRLLWPGTDVRVTKMGDIIAQNLKAVGIRTVLTPLERSAVNQVGYVGYQFDMIIDSYGLGPDPDIGVERLYNSNNILKVPFVNSSGYQNPEVDALFDEQRVKIDFAQRKAIYDKIQEILWRDVPAMPICAYSGPAVVRSRDVKNAFVTWNTVIENLTLAEPAGA